MRRTRCLVLVVVALIFVAAASAWGDPWPNYSSAHTGYPVFVTSSYDSGTDLWTYNVYVDPNYDLMAFVVYPTNLTPTTPLTPVEGWTGYNYSNTAGWTTLNGGWEYTHPSDTSAAFGWMAAPGPSERLQGQGYTPTATFVGQDLPSGTYDLFSVRVYDRATGVAYWAQSGPVPGIVPEPGTLAASLALLAPGGISLARWRLRVRRARRSRTARPGGAA